MEVWCRDPSSSWNEQPLRSQVGGREQRLAPVLHCPFPPFPWSFLYHSLTLTHIHSHTHTVCAASSSSHGPPLPFMHSQVSSDGSRFLSGCPHMIGNPYHLCRLGWWAPHLGTLVPRTRPHHPLAKNLAVLGQCTSAVEMIWRKKNHK